MACFKVKVNLFVCLIKHRAMNTYVRIEELLRATLISAPMKVGKSASRPGRFIPRIKTFPYPLENRNLGTHESGEVSFTPWPLYPQDKDFPISTGEQAGWAKRNILRSRVRFPALPDFLRGSGSGTGSTQPREYL
jgi:hypothetical protein